MTGSLASTFVDDLLNRAYAEGASDVHFLTQTDGTLVVRLRVEGVLLEVSPPDVAPRAVLEDLLARCPNLSSADFNTNQDDAFTFTAHDAPRRVRLAMLRGVGEVPGPLVVLRLASSAAAIEQMGIDEVAGELAANGISFDPISARYHGKPGYGKSRQAYLLARATGRADADKLEALLARPEVP